MREVSLRGHGLAHLRPSLLNSFPEFIRHNPQLGPFLNSPLASGVVAHDAPAGAGFMLDRLLAPDLTTKIPFVDENLPNGRLRPPFARRAWDARRVQSFNNRRQAHAVRGPVENAPNDGGFLVIHLDALPEQCWMAVVILLARGVRDRNGSIAVLAASGGESLSICPARPRLTFFASSLRYNGSMRPCTANSASACSDSESILWEM
jgi:hypothetical protein